MTAPTLDTYVPPPGLRREPRRDDRGRPYIVTPEGRETTYSRASSFGKPLEDTYLLERWKQRQVLVGASLDPHIILSAAAHRDQSDKANKDKLNDLVEQAHQAAKAHARAEIGTAIHKIGETLDAGGDPGPYPLEYHSTVEAYRRRTAGFEWVFIEQFVVHHQLKVAGTTDRVRRLPDGRLRVVDIKTGDTLDFGKLGIAVQVAVYTNSEPYDLGTGQTLAWPAEMDLQVAEIIHVPAGQGVAELYTVDIAEGIKAAQDALQLRNMRKAAESWIIRVPWHPAEAPAETAAKPSAQPATTAIPPGQVGQLVQTSAGPQIVPRPHSQAPASPPAPGPVVVAPEGVVNPATGEVHAQADDAQPAGAALLALLRQVFATVGAPWPTSTAALTNLDVRKILTHWEAVQLDAADGKLEPGQTPAAAMIEFLIGGGLVPDGTLAQPRVLTPGGPTMPTLAVPAAPAPAPAGPSAADVLAWIPQAPTEADLTALWQQYGGTPAWDARHDAAAGARFQQLQAAQFTAAQQTAGQMLGAVPVPVP